MNLELLKHAKDYIEKMANGINPLTGEFIPDGELINNIRISRCLFYVNSVLGEVLQNGGVSKSKAKSKKIPFNLSKDEVSKYKYQDEDLPISKIVQGINSLKQNEEMAKLKATDVCKWLISIGLLEEYLLNSKKYKRPTENGKNMGMYLEHRIGKYGEYNIVIYKREAQEFIIDNFESLIDFINK